MAEQDNQTLFNAGVSKLLRIDGLRRQTHIARIEKNYDLWYRALLGIRIEIAERLKPKEDKEIDHLFKSIKNTINNNKWDNITESLLVKLDIILTKLEYQYGYSMPDKEDDDGL